MPMRQTFQADKRSIFVIDPCSFHLSSCGIRLIENDNGKIKMKSRYLLQQQPDSDGVGIVAASRILYIYYDRIKCCQLFPACCERMIGGIVKRYPIRYRQDVYRRKCRPVLPGPAARQTNHVRGINTFLSRPCSASN